MKSFAIVHSNEAPVRASPLRERDGEVSRFTAYVAEFFPVEGATLELKRVSLPPGAVIAPHRHDYAEVLYVLDGSLSFGAQTCEAGSGVYVAAEARYGFVAGSDGCTFLNFRGVVGTSIRFADETTEAVGQADAGSPA